MLRRDDFDDTPAEGVFAREPGGRRLTLTIFTTWGDPHYVGLSAVELYDMQGELIALADVKAQVRAEPADVNVLPGYGSDPRVVANLFDGALATCDDHHLWLAPFTAARARHGVRRPEVAPPALARADLELQQESDPLVPRRAPRRDRARRRADLPRRDQQGAGQRVRGGELRGADPLHRRAPRNSARFGANSSDQSDAPPGRLRTRACSARSSGETPSASPPPSPPRRRRRRPSGRHRRARMCAGCGPAPTTDGRRPPRLHGRVATERPTTAAVRPAAAAGPSAADGWAATQDYETAVHPQGTNLELLLMSTRGDARGADGRDEPPPAAAAAAAAAAASPPRRPDVPPVPPARCQPAAVPRRRSRPRRAREGLNGSEILDPSGAPIRLRVDQLRARPHSVNDLPEVKGDPRTPDKLVDGVNDTYDDAHMWLAPFARGSNLLSISLTSVQRGGQRIGALRLWNYAKAARGVDTLRCTSMARCCTRARCRRRRRGRRGCAPTVPPTPVSCRRSCSPTTGR